MITFQAYADALNTENFRYFILICTLFTIRQWNDLMHLSFGSKQNSSQYVQFIDKSKPGSRVQNPLRTYPMNAEI